MPRYQDIPSFTRHAAYAVDIPWDHLERTLGTYVDDYHLDTDPDFQRGYVWTPDQKVSFIEFRLRGGMTGGDIYTNCPGWNGTARDMGAFVLVDGKQRLNAIMGYLRNEYKVFGHYHKDYTDRLDMFRAKVRWHVNDLRTRREVLQWYLDLNSGGTVHTEKDLGKVRAMLAKEPK